MPELPEVENIRLNLVNEGLLGRVIRGVEVHWQNSVGNDTNYKQKLLGSTICSLNRRGKYLVFDTSKSYKIVAHMRMSGRLSLVDQSTPKSGYERVVFLLDKNQELRFHDPRKFGRMILVLDDKKHLSDLAIEPLSEGFTIDYVSNYLKKSKRQIKPLLLDQKALTVGIGNIYADEALFGAQIHPKTLASKIDKEKVEKLSKTIKDVLEKGIKNFGTSLGDGQSNYKLPTKSAKNQEQLWVFRQTGEPCKRCRTKIKRILVGQRASHICPSCQPLGN